MKKIISMILVFAIALSMASCKKEKNEDVIDNNIEATQGTEIEATTEPTESEAPKETEKVEENKKPQSTPTSSPTDKPTQAPTQKPTETPTQKPSEKPTETPTQKPTEAPKSVGNILLSEFKKKADSSALSIAEALVNHSVIEFAGGAIPVEPGYLTGFGNTEIKGFKEGAMFAPQIGTIPFVGYIFTLENASDTASFISTLKSSADLRWNICTEADEMITGSVGNKVFFVMSPISFEEE